MYAKVFEQIFDSSIAEDHLMRLVFEDLLVLADQNGVVDKTHEAIARRTNVPLEIVKREIAELEKPDPKSRTPIYEGRRLVRLDEHKEWGWVIVNYQHYREIASEEQRREKTRERVSRFRAGKKKECNAYVTRSNDSPSASSSTDACISSSSDKEIGCAPDIDIPESLQTPDFLAAWGKWRKHRKEIRKPLTLECCMAQMRRFVEWGPERAAAAIEHTIFQGWQGIREEQKHGGGYGGKQTASERRAEQASREYEEHIVVPTL